MRIGGGQVGVTGTPFVYTFAATAPEGTVSGDGYQDAAIPWPPLVPPALMTRVSPAPTPLNTPIQLLVTVTERLRPRVPASGPDPIPPQVIDPTATVHATGYPDAPVPFDFP